MDIFNIGTYVDSYRKPLYIVFALKCILFVILLALSIYYYFEKDDKNKKFKNIYIGNNGFMLFLLPLLSELIWGIAFSFA